MAAKEPGIDKIVAYIRKSITENKKPFVPWGDLLNHADDMLKGVPRPRLNLWSIMEPHVFSISEDDPKSEKPKLYEYKLGAVYYYYPVDMIDSCSKTRT